MSLGAPNKHDITLKMDPSKIAIFIIITGILLNSLVFHILISHRLHRRSSFLIPTLIILCQLVALTFLMTVILYKVAYPFALENQIFCQFEGTFLYFIYACIILLHYAEAINPVLVLIRHKPPLNTKQLVVLLSIILGLGLFVTLIPFVGGPTYKPSPSELICFVNYGGLRLGQRFQLLIAAIFMIGFPIYYGTIQWLILRELRSLQRFNRRQTQMLQKVELAIFRRGLLLTTFICLTWAYPMYNYVRLIFHPYELSSTEAICQELFTISSGISLPLGLVFADESFQKRIKFW